MKMKGLQRAFVRDEKRSVCSSGDYGDMYQSAIHQARHLRSVQLMKYAYYSSKEEK